MHTELPIIWSAWYNSEWDSQPEAYLQVQVVKPTRSRRLGRYYDPLHERKGYIGVYHQVDPHKIAGRTRFFLSLFLYGQTLGLKSFATISDLLVVLEAFHARVDS